MSFFGRLPTFNVLPFPRWYNMKVTLNLFENYNCLETKPKTNQEQIIRPHSCLPCGGSGEGLFPLGRIDSSLSNQSSIYAHPPESVLVREFNYYLWGVGEVKPPIHFFAYNMQKGGGWVQITCKIAYVLNGRPLSIKIRRPASALLEKK